MLRCIDTVDEVREHHPFLFALGLHPTARSPEGRTCRWLVREWEAHKRDRRPASSMDRQLDYVEAIEGEWLDAHVDDRREYSDARKRRFATDRRAARGSLSTRQLLALAFAAEPALSTVPAAGFERGRGGGSGLLQHQQTFEDDPRYRYAMRQVRHFAEQLLDLQEESRGLGVAAVEALMIASEKDKEILKVRGTPREVFELLGKEIAGSPRTVERVRTKGHQCKWCGGEMPDGTGGTTR